MSYILVTNDDGVHSPGLAALADAAARIAPVVIVAPDRNRSAVGHALTLYAPLRAEELRPGVFAVDGTPTDCVNLGVHGLVEGTPQLVVSGINSGANLGDDITYSGTVSAALEAALMGYPALAFSLNSRIFEVEALNAATSVAETLMCAVLQHGLPPDTFLNINIPLEKIKGICLTRQGKRRYSDDIVQKTDPRGRSYYWIGGGVGSFEDQPGTDCHAVNAGLVSVTPLTTGLTNHAAFAQIEAWNLSLPQV